jgi:CRISPR-associated protein Cas1
MLKSLDDDAHVKTRLCQYEAVNNWKGVYIAKQLILSKFEGQNMILEKHGLETHVPTVRYELERLESESLEHARRKLIAVEAKYSKRYFSQVFKLFPERLRPSSRETFQAYDGINNAFNLAYEVLSWKVHRALIKAKLEPYLGFLHSLQFGKPSLVCDFQELYRYLIDDFLIYFCRKLNKKDFNVKAENASRVKKGKREYLNSIQTRDLMVRLNQYFEGKVEIPRIKHGNRQTLETLVNEEALLFAKFLRGERETWLPRIAVVNF